MNVYHGSREKDRLPVSRNRPWLDVRNIMTSLPEPAPAGNPVRPACDAPTPPVNPSGPPGENRCPECRRPLRWNLGTPEGRAAWAEDLMSDLGADVDIYCSCNGGDLSRLSRNPPHLGDLAAWLALAVWSVRNGRELGQENEMAEEESPEPGGRALVRLGHRYAQRLEYDPKEVPTLLPDRHAVIAALTNLYVQVRRALVPPSPQMVTREQIALLLHITKKHLERKMNRDAQCPRPAREGEGGQAHLYRWDEVRPWLAQALNRPDLPVRFPDLNPPPNR